MGLQTMFELIGQYGLPIALVIYFVWRDREREILSRKKESEMQTYVQMLEKEMRVTLIRLVEQTSKIIVANSRAMSDWIEVMKIKPCLADDLTKKFLEETVQMVRDAKKQ